MALKTKVNIKYRTPYIPHTELPKDQERLMRQEITEFRKNLIKKQKRLEKSTEFNHDERLYNQLKELKVKDLKTDKQVWQTWNRLNLLEQAHSTSITGKKETQRLQIESLNEAGFDFITKENFKDFYEFMNFAKEECGDKVISSDIIAQWYTEHRKDESRREIQNAFIKWKNNGFKES